MNEKKPPQKEDYTTGELAEAAGISTAYIRRLLLMGRLRGRKRGRDWIISAREAERWLEERKRPVPPEGIPSG